MILDRRENGKMRLVRERDIETERQGCVWDG